MGEVIVLGVDPGTRESAIVSLKDGKLVVSAFIMPNEELLATFRDGAWPPGTVLAIEEFESYGMAVGKEVFRTIRWAGNFEERWYPGRVTFIPRRTIKLHICHTSRATDANIRTELIDRYGGPDVAIGKKKTPGPLYGVKSHAWAALALAITWWDLHHEDPEQIRPGVNADF